MKTQPDRPHITFFAGHFYFWFEIFDLKFYLVISNPTNHGYYRMIKSPFALKFFQENFAAVVKNNQKVWEKKKKRMLLHHPAK